MHLRTAEDPGSLHGCSHTVPMAVVAMTDRYRTLTALAVLLVAAIAAVIGYQHVVALALRYGQPVLAAYLLPSASTASSPCPPW